MILSYYDLGDVFYDSANKTSIAKLQKIQNASLRFKTRIKQEMNNKINFPE